MISDISDKIKILETDLMQIDIENPDILKKSEKTIFCINDCLKQLKEYICQNQFSSQEEGIQFFKEIKTLFLWQTHIVKIFNIESKRPNGSEKSQKNTLLTNSKFFFRKSGILPVH